MEDQDKAKAIIDLIKEHESNLANCQLNSICSLLINPCPNALIMIFVFSYVYYCKNIDFTLNISFDDVDMLTHCHHLIKKIKKNMSFQPDMTPEEILEVDNHLFNIFSGKIESANTFLYKYYYVVVDFIENEDDSPRLQFACERIHWCFNTKITNINEFLDGTFGYDRPDAVVVLTLLLSKDVIEYDLTDQQTFSLNWDSFSELNARINLVNPMISIALLQPEMTRVIQQRLIQLIYVPTRIIRALLLIKKIFNAVIAEDDVQMNINLELYKFYNLKELFTSSQNNRDIILQKMIQIKHIFFGNESAFERIHVFFWTVHDKKFLKDCKKDSLLLQTPVSSQREAHWYYMFNLLAMHKDVVLGKEPCDIIHRDVVIDLRIWYKTQKRNYRNGLLSSPRYNSLVNLMEEDIFITYDKILDDIKWMRMYNILVEIGGYSLTHSLTHSFTHSLTHSLRIYS